MKVFLYVLLAIAVLLFMILIHEFGHYIAGKILKFKINEFAIGFGPAIFSHTSKKTGEKFSLRIFPLGGYCAFDGEEDDGKGETVGSFNLQKPWKRIIVFLAGVTANFISGILFSWILLCTIGYDVPQIAKTQTYKDNTFYAGEVITHIDGKKIDFAFGTTFDLDAQYEKAEAFYAIEDNQGQLYTFTIRLCKDGQVRDMDVVVYQVEKVEDGKTTTEYITGLIPKAYVYGVWEGFCRSFELTVGFVWVVLKTLWQMITFQMDWSQGGGGGTIAAIATMATVAADANLKVFLIFMPAVAANLAIMNLLPFPALDGSHVLFTIIEWIRGKPLNKKIENIIHTVGIIALLALVVVMDIVFFIIKYT